MGAATRPEMNSVGDSFAWAFRDSAWLGKMLVQGLIAIIPIVGWIAMTGWLMMAYDNARAGRNELPPAGFHLGRGIEIFLVFLIYGVVLSIPSAILYSIAIVAASNSGDNAGAVSAPLFTLAGLAGVATTLLTRFLYPSLIVNTARGGLAGGLNVQHVWQLSSLNVTNTVVAALIIFVASIIGGLGFLVCIGFIFTIPYENTITAAAAAWFDQQQSAPGAAPPVTPTT